MARKLAGQKPGSSVESGEGIESLILSSLHFDGLVYVESGEGIESDRSAPGMEWSNAYVESGEGIESFKPANTDLGKTLYVESGEGIESEVLPTYLADDGVVRWNPVKELKVSLMKCSRPLRCLLWNPVKELKVLQRTRTKSL